DTARQHVGSRDRNEGAEGRGRLLYGVRMLRRSRGVSPRRPTVKVAASSCPASGVHSALRSVRDPVGRFRLATGLLASSKAAATSCAVVTHGTCSDGARRGTEPLAKSARKMGVIAKAAGVRDITKRLNRLRQRAAFDQTR